MKMKQLLWAFIAIAAMTLVGCGGSGGGTSLMVGGERATQDLIDALASRASTAEAAVTRLTDELETANTNAMTIQDQLDDANGMIDDLNMQIADAPTQQMVDDLTAMRDDYRQQVESLQTMLDDANDMVTQLTNALNAANDRLAAIERENEQTNAKAMRDDRIQREMRLREVLVNTDGTATDNRIPATYTAKATPTEADSGVTGVTITRSVAGNVNIDVNGTLEDDYTGGSVNAGSGSWNSAMLTKTDAVTEDQDVLVIYTDIDAPADKLFTAQYSQDQLDNILDNTITDADAAAARNKLVMSAGFPSAPLTTWVYDGSQTGRSKSFAGTFDGVPGQYTCTATTCTVVTTATGAIDFGAEDASPNDWRFTPNSPNDATVKDPDTGYAWFGWWLNKPKDNEAEHDVEVFAGGSTGYAATVAASLEGNATYSGPAAGKYITKTFSAGAQTDAGVGHFTANASLTARFGDDTGVGTISGSISGFVLDDTDSTTAAAWRVMLESATLADGTATFSSTTEANFGGGATTNDIGRWQGSFYNASPLTVAEDSRYPNTVVGTFDAVTDNAAVIGGFGADRQ